MAENLDFARFALATGRSDWRPEVARGWWPLIWRMFDDLDGVLEPGHWRVEKVREKVGALDVDVVAENVHSDQFRRASDIIDRAEFDSESICEFCGNVGLIAQWSLRFRCLCPDHAAAVWRSRTQMITEARGTSWRCELVDDELRIVDAMGARASKRLLDTVSADLYRSMSSEDPMPRRSDGEIGRELDLLIAARWIACQ